MAKYLHTEGICLRRIQYSNTSQVAGFLTPDVGRLSVIAKGVTRAPKKGIRTGFDLLGRYEIVYTMRRNGSLHNLTYRWLRDGFRGLRGTLERILCAYYAAELMLNFTAEAQPCPALYAELLRALSSFAAGEALGLHALRLELAALREHGSCPAFGACAECGKPVPGSGAAAFSAAAGGPLCRRCRRAPRGPTAGRIRSTNAAVLHGLADLAARLDIPTGPDAGRDAAGPAPKPKDILAMSSLLHDHMRYLLGKELRMWKYLQRRALSRSLQRLRRKAGLT